MKNAHDSFEIVELIPAQAATATVTGAAANIRQYVGKVKVILMSSIGGGTTPTLDVKIQDSPDGSTGWADVSGATFTQVTDAADSTQDIGMEIDSINPFVRAVGTITGTSPTFSFAVGLIGMQQVPTT